MTPEERRQAARKKRLARVTAWSGQVGRSLPARVDLIEAKTLRGAMAEQRRRDSSIQSSQQSAGWRRKPCEMVDPEKL